MNVITKRLDELHKLEKNVRRHNEKQISEYVRSLKMFGQIRPIVIDENNVMLCGNGMYEAMTRMGWETCECYVIEGLSEKNKTKLMLADNRLYELGMTDMKIFEEIVQGLEGDIDVPGWDEDLLETLQASMADMDEMISSYGLYEPEEVERVSERRREDHTALNEPSAPMEPLQQSSAPMRDAEQVSDSPQMQTASAPTERLTERFIICPHCGEKIPLPVQMGGV